MRSARTLEELRGHVGDVLDVASLSDAQMLQTLLKKINGSATLKQLLVATLSVARGRESNRIAELERELEATEDQPELEDELRDLRRKVAAMSKLK